MRPRCDGHTYTQPVADFWRLALMESIGERPWEAVPCPTLPALSEASRLITE